MTTTTALKLLGSALLVALVGIVALAILERPIPDILELLAASSLSAIAGVAAPRIADAIQAPNGAGGDHRREP